jgi:hypothetical protein
VQQKDYTRRTADQPSGWFDIGPPFVAADQPLQILRYLQELLRCRRHTPPPPVKAQNAETLWLMTVPIYMSFQYSYILESHINLT